MRKASADTETTRHADGISGGRPSRFRISRRIEKFQSDVFLSDKQEQHFGIAQRNSLELVGELAYFYKPGDCITLGITVAPRFQRNGYACEMLREVIRSVREKYPTLDIVALIDKGNRKSLCLFEKLGFRQECYADSIASFVYVLSA